MAKPKLPRFQTPKGTAMWCWLNKPDTKFNANGDYKVTVRMPKDSAAKLIADLEPIHAESVAEARKAFAKNPKNKAKKYEKERVIRSFYADSVDEDGNETGEVEFSFKCRAGGTREDGSTWTRKPDLFDVKGNVLAADARIFGGSIIKVDFSVKGYDSPVSGTGISLLLEGVQVIKLVEGQRNAASHGFSDESEDEDADDTDSSESEGEGESSEDADDTTTGGEGDDF